MVGLATASIGSVPYYYPRVVGRGALDMRFEPASVLFMPGLILSALLGGNVHDVSLTFGLLLNWAFYGVGLFLFLGRNRRSGPGSETR